MKKLVKSILCVVILLSLSPVAQIPTVHASSVPASCAATPYAPFCILQQVQQKTNLPDFYKHYQHPDTADEYQYSGVKSLTSPVYYAIDIFRFIISGIALLVVLYYAFLLVSQASDETTPKAKNGLIYGALGLVLIQIAASVVKNMFFGEYGEAFATGEEGELVTGFFADNTVAEIRGIIGIINMVVGAVAVLVLVIRGFTLIAGFGEEDAMTKARKHVMYAAIGLLIVALSESIIRGVIFPEAGTVLPDINYGKKIIVDLTNFISGFVAIIAFLVLFYAGYLYVVSGGEDDSKDTIKKIFIGAVIGLLLSLSAYAIVNALIDLEVPEVKSQIEEAVL